MADFNDHISQAHKNIRILEDVNNNVQDSVDWQVTICFYIAVHLANAHIAQSTGQHYRTHNQVDQALNPYSPINPSMFSIDAYLAYQRLSGLSRRSRYLCSDNIADTSINTHFTSEKHLAKALRNLNEIITFFSTKYNINFSTVNLKCARIKQDKLEFFVGV